MYFTVSAKQVLKIKINGKGQKRWHTRIFSCAHTKWYCTEAIPKVTALFDNLWSQNAGTCTILEKRGFSEESWRSAEHLESAGSPSIFQPKASVYTCLQVCKVAVKVLLHSVLIANHNCAFFVSTKRKWWQVWKCGCETLKKNKVQPCILRTVRKGSTVTDSTLCLSMEGRWEQASDVNFPFVFWTKFVNCSQMKMVIHTWDFDTAESWWMNDFERRWVTFS